MIIENNNPYTQASFSLKNRIARALWGISWLLLFRPSPRPFHKWRVFILRLFGANLGCYVHIHSSVKIWAPWQLVVGNYVGIGESVNIYNMAPICIGDYAVVSQGSHLCTGSHDFNSLNFQLYAKPISIENNAWVCADVFLGPGVIIPEGVVIGARSVVFKSPKRAWAVYVGNPVNYLKDRVRHAK